MVRYYMPQSLFATIIAIIAYIPMNYSFDNNHISERIADLMNHTTFNIIKKNHGELTMALLCNFFSIYQGDASCNELEFEEPKIISHMQDSVKTSFMYQLSKSGLRLKTSFKVPITSDDTIMPLFKAPLSAITPSQEGYVYDSNTVCVLFTCFNLQFEKELIGNCTTSLPPRSDSPFLMR